MPLYLAGKRLEYMLGILMLGGTLGYGVAVTSYDQQMIFTYISETRLMPDLDTMSDAIDQVFDELLTEARRVNAPPSTEPIRVESAKRATREGEGASKPAA